MTRTTQKSMATMRSRDDDPNAAHAKRRRLVLATTLAGGAGLAASALPFIASMTPSERARSAGAPVGGVGGGAGAGEPGS